MFYLALLHLRTQKNAEICDGNCKMENCPSRRMEGAPDKIDPYEWETLNWLNWLNWLKSIVKGPMGRNKTREHMNPGRRIRRSSSPSLTAVALLALSSARMLPRFEDGDTERESGDFK